MGHNTPKWSLLPALLLTLTLLSCSAGTSEVTTHDTSGEIAIGETSCTAASCDDGNPCTTNAHVRPHERVSASR